MSIKDILYESGINARPSFYSGRGATLTDLNSTILLKIQDNIKAFHGEDAAKAFVRMVQSMENMNCTAFINNCFRLESNDYQWEETEPETNDIAIDKNTNGDYDIYSGIMTVGAKLGSGQRDDTKQITSQFLRSNGIEPKRSISHYGYFY